MKINSVIQRIQSLYSRGVQSDDSSLQERHIYNKMISTRAKLIVQDLNKKKALSPWVYQVLPCVELVKVPRVECDCLTIPGCQLLKSRYPLPKPLLSIYTSAIKSVTSVEDSVSFTEITRDKLKYLKGAKYTSKSFYYWIENNYLYLSTIKAPKIVRVEEILEDPLDAVLFPSYCDTDCTDCDTCIDILDQDFPLENSKIDDLVNLCVNELILLFKQSQQDVSNDTREDQNQPQQN